MTNILIAGDFCPCHRVAKLFDDEKYGTVLDQVRQFTRQADYSIVNLEAPIVLKSATPIDKTGPHLKCSKQSLGAIKYAGFDMVTLANNHFYDYGDIGVNDTLKSCEEYNIDVVGGGNNIEEAKQISFKVIKGKKFAFVNFCENEWSIATQNTGGSNPLNIVSNYNQIQDAKHNADYVIVIVHGGHEQLQIPSPRMKETYHFFADIGADVVINHHQHCISGYEEYKGKLIFYGLGNFCFDAPSMTNDIWNQGYCVSLKFEKDISFELLPYFQCGEKPSIEFIVDKTDFLQEIDKLNSIILNDFELNTLYNNIISEKKKWVELLLQPYSNRYLATLYIRGLFPSMTNKKRKHLLLNLIKCESHRDILLNTLKV